MTPNSGCSKWGNYNINANVTFFLKMKSQFVHQGVRKQWNGHPLLVGDSRWFELAAQNRFQCKEKKSISSYSTYYHNVLPCGLSLLTLIKGLDLQLSKNLLSCKNPSRTLNHSEGVQSADRAVHFTQHAGEEEERKARKGL